LLEIENPIVVIVSEVKDVVVHQSLHFVYVVLGCRDLLLHLPHVVGVGDELLLQIVEPLRNFLLLEVELEEVLFAFGLCNLYLLRQVFYLLTYLGLSFVYFKYSVHFLLQLAEFGFQDTDVLLVTARDDVLLRHLVKQSLHCFLNGGADLVSLDKLVDLVPRPLDDQLSLELLCFLSLFFLCLGKLFCLVLQPWS